MMSGNDDRRDARRQQKAWQEDLEAGNEVRVMVKGAMTAPSNPVSSGTPTPYTRFVPTMVEVWVCVTDYDTVLEDGQEFAPQIVTDEVLRVAIYDPSFPSRAAPVGKTGVYGRVRMIDGIIEFTWLGC